MQIKEGVKSVIFLANMFLSFMTSFHENKLSNKKKKIRRKTLIHIGKIF